MGHGTPWMVAALQGGFLRPLNTTGPAGGCWVHGQVFWPAGLQQPGPRHPGAFALPTGGMTASQLPRRTSSLTPCAAAGCRPGPPSACPAGSVATPQLEPVGRGHLPCTRRLVLKQPRV